MEHKLIAAGVENLQAMGHVGCNAGNIQTDATYAKEFSSMLTAQKEELETSSHVSGRGDWAAREAEIIKAIDALLGKTGAVQ